MSDEKLSEEFERAFFDDGRLVHQCQCGREHYATYGNEGCFEPGELERLEKNPNSQAHDYSSLGVGYMGEKSYVQNCPCVVPEVKKYEDFIWNQRKLIAEFLNARLDKIVQEAKDDKRDNSIKELS